MPTRRAFWASLVVAVVVFSVLADRGPSPQRAGSGTVAAVHPGERMVVANEHMRLPVRLSKTTTYEGNSAGLTPGTRVTVWYRSVAERRLVADKVRLLADAPTR